MQHNYRTMLANQRAGAVPHHHDEWGNAVSIKSGRSVVVLGLGGLTGLAGAAALTQFSVLAKVSDSTVPPDLR